MKFQKLMWKFVKSLYAIGDQFEKDSGPPNIRPRDRPITGILDDFFLLFNADMAKKNLQIKVVKKDEEYFLVTSMGTILIHQDYFRYWNQQTRYHRESYIHHFLTQLMMMDFRKAKKAFFRLSPEQRQNVVETGLFTQSGDMTHDLMVALLMAQFLTDIGKRRCQAIFKKNGDRMALNHQFLFLPEFLLQLCKNNPAFEKYRKILLNGSVNGERVVDKDEYHIALNTKGGKFKANCFDVMCKELCELIMDDYENGCFNNCDMETNLRLMIVWLARFHMDAHESHMMKRLQNDTRIPLLWRLLIVNLSHCDESCKMDNQDLATTLLNSQTAQEKASSDNVWAILTGQNVAYFSQNYCPSVCLTAMLKGAYKDVVLAYSGKSDKNGPFYSPCHPDWDAVYGNYQTQVYLFLRHLLALHSSPTLFGNTSPFVSPFCMSSVKKILKGNLQYSKGLVNLLSSLQVLWTIPP